MTRFLAFPLILACGSFGTAQAHPYSAQREFFHLKRVAEFFNYVENETYVEVVGTTFIGLQAAFNSHRTCVYGFNQPHLDNPGSYQTRTRFVCFNSNQYQLSMKKEYCELGSEGCEIDPGGISVGIGNLDIAEPTVPGEVLPLPKPGSFYNTYPKVINFDVYKPLRFSIDPDNVIFPDVAGKE